MDGPPPYEAVAAHEGTRYYIVNIPADIYNSDGAISINMTDASGAMSRKAYHVAFQDTKGFQVHRGESEDDPVVANVKFRFSAPLGVDMAFASGEKASMDFNDIRKSTDKNKMVPASSEESQVAVSGEEKQRLPIKMAGGASPMAWEMTRKMSSERSGSFFKNKLAHKEEDINIDLAFFNDETISGSPSALFTNTTLENENSKDKDRKNEWGYLTTTDAQAFQRQERLELVLTTLVCVLEINMRLYGRRGSRSLGALGAASAALVVFCSIM